MHNRLPRTLVRVTCSAFAALMLLAGPAGATPVSPPVPPASVAVQIGRHLSGGLGALASDDGVVYRIESGAGDKVRYVAKFTNVPAAENVVVVLQHRGTRTCLGTVDFYNWPEGVWAQDRSITVSHQFETQETFFKPAAAHRSEAGVVKMRVTCFAGDDYVLMTDVLTAQGGSPP